MAYLDANASERPRPEAREAVLAALEGVGNPASVHAAGRAARRRLEDARESLAACLGAAADAVVFTSGGTEANALALGGLSRGRRILRGATEHDAVRAAGGDAGVLAVDGQGRLDLAACEAALAGAAGAPALVCLMLANNETGVIHPLADAARLCRAHGALLHVDAVQAPGRMPVDFAALGADSLAVSSHKVGGPAGAGALLLGERAAATFAPMMLGGGQERGRRGGTPPVSAIAGFAAAARAATRDMAATAERLARLRDAAEAAAVASGAVVLGGGAPRLANTTCLALPGVAALTQVIALDLAGIAVSAGAACSSGKVARSHVLDAMGAGALAGEAIRVSLPWDATEANIGAFADAYAAMARRLAARAA